MGVALFEVHQRPQCALDAVAGRCGIRPLITQLFRGVLAIVADPA